MANEELKVEARNIRTVALNEMNAFQQRAIKIRQYFIDGYYTKDEYLSILAHCNNMIQRAAYNLNLASAVLATMR